MRAFEAAARLLSFKRAAAELASGALVPVFRITLPGLGFYIVHRPTHPKLGSIKAFIDWARSAVSAR